MSLGRAILEHSQCLSDEQEAYLGHMQLGVHLRVKGRKVVPARHLYHLLPLGGSAGSWKLLTIDRDLMVAQFSTPNLPPSLVSIVGPRLEDRNYKLPCLRTGPKD